MTKIIYIIDYRDSLDSGFQYRGEQLAKLIDNFYQDNQNPFHSIFFQHAAEIPWKENSEKEKDFPLVPFLIFLHKGNELLYEDKEHYRRLVDFCGGKKIPVVIFTGEIPGPGQVNIKRLISKLNPVLKRLVNEKVKDIAETIVGIVNGKSSQDDILKYYNRYIKPQLSLLKFTLDGFLMLYGAKKEDAVLSDKNWLNSHARAAVSNWSWFSPLIESDQKILGNDEDYSSYCRLFTPQFDLRLSEFYCLSMAEKSTCPDKNLQESLESAFEKNEKHMVKAVCMITGKNYSGMEQILKDHRSIGKMLAKNAGKYSIPLLINPEIPPLSPEEKKYLQSFVILDGDFKMTFLNLWSKEVDILLPSYIKAQLNNSLRKLVEEIYSNRGRIEKSLEIENVGDFKLRITEGNKILSRITGYFEKEIGEYECNI
jgi:hypothetical protein